MSKNAILSIFALLTISVPGCAGDSEKKNQQEEAAMPALEIRSEAFNNGESIPARYTCDGDEISPRLTWSKPPEGTKELVLICDDPDAPVRTWVHWIVYGIHPDSTSLSEGIGKIAPGEAIQGKNSSNQVHYSGPCPPRGPAHRYFFKLYALDQKLELEPGASKAEVEEAMEGHILAKGELMGKYAR